MDATTERYYTMGMLRDVNDSESRLLTHGDRRPYGRPSLTVHGRMTDLTEAGNGNGKEANLDNKRPITLSNA